MTRIKLSDKELMRRLANRLSFHAFCNTHEEKKADLLDCPFCRDRDTYIQYVWQTKDTK